MTTGELGARDQTRLQHYVREADLTWVVAMLRANRDRILMRWLRAVEEQPFHRGRRDRAVIDELPPFFDALIEGFARVEPKPGPINAEHFATIARNHAQARAAQGLLPAEAVMEFRLLRNEVLQALRESLTESEDVSDLLGGWMIFTDALDGAIEIAINYFIELFEQSKDDFIAITAHDLRTPLTVLKGSAQVARRQISAGHLDPEALERNLGLIEASSNRIEQLLTALLDFSRVTAGRLTVEPSPTDLVEIVEHVIGRLGEEARQRIETTVTDSPLVGNWESSRIEQVVENLLSNALKYAPSDAIRVTLAREEQGARLEVRDHGIGLSLEDRAQLFRRFYRSPEVIERKIEGTGLGLYICRGIILAHGGNILIASPGRDQGTTVIIRLPFAGPFVRSSGMQ